MLLSQFFYKQSTNTIAIELLGCFLVRQDEDIQIIGRIVETESYLRNDPAAHSYIGKTTRNAVLFGNPGNAYVYFIYGMYYCLNVVTAAPGIGEAVLIRAVEPIKGISYMEKRRKTKDKLKLCNGPGKLAQAFDINLSLNGIPFTSPQLQLWSPDSIPGFKSVKKEDIITTTRIGINKAKDLPLRFYVKNNPFVSKK